MDWVAFTRDNWAVIAQAPWAFVTCAVLFLGIGMALQSWLHSGATSAKDERLQLADDRIAEYERKLRVASPDEAVARLAKLEADVASFRPYSLSADQVARLTRVIAREQHGIAISRDNSSVDADVIHRQVATVFANAGWATVESVILGLKRPPICGLTLVKAPGGSTSELELLREALEAADLEWVETEVEGNQLPVHQLVFSSRRNR